MEGFRVRTAVPPGIGLMILFALGGSEAPAQVAPLPIEAFTRFDEIGDIQLSPSGEYAAYLTGDFGRTFIVFIKVSDRKVVGGVRLTEGLQVAGFDWVSDTRLVYSIAERIPGREQPAATGEMYAVDYNGKNHAMIYGARALEERTSLSSRRSAESSYAFAEIISTLEADDKNVLIAEYEWKRGAASYTSDPDAQPQLYLLDVNTGAKRFKGKAPLARATVLIDQDDQPRFATGYNTARKLAVIWKPDPAGDWKEFALPGFRAETVFPLVFSADNQSVYIYGVKEGESQRALFTVNLQTQEVTKLYGSQRADISDLLYDVRGKKILGAEVAVDKPEIFWLDKDENTAKIYRSLQKALPDQHLRFVSATRDGHLLIARAGSDVNPGDYYLFDTRAMKAEFLVAKSRWIDPRRMRPKEPFTIKARDGLDLHGYLTRAEGEGPHPLIVHPHGGPHGPRDYWDYDWEVQLLASRGYSVLQLNFRGSGGYGMDFEAKGYKQWGATMQDDLTDATRWAIEQKIAPADRICIFGASYGGFASLSGVVREPRLYRCAIGYAGVYDLELMRTTGDVPRTRYGQDFLKLALGEDVESMRARSPARHADQIQVPVLLIHGKADWRAAFEQAEAMKAALDKNKKYYEWMALSREGHGVYNEASRREVYERILAFLDKYLKQTS